MRYADLVSLFDAYSEEAGIANGKTLFEKIQKSPTAQKIISLKKEVLPYIGEYLRYAEHPAFERTKAFKNAWLALVKRIVDDNNIKDTPPFLSEPHIWIQWMTSAPHMLYEPENVFFEQQLNNATDNLPAGYYDKVYMTDKYSSIELAVKAADYVEIFTVKNSIGLYFYHLTYKKTGKDFYLRIHNEKQAITVQMDEATGCALYLMGYEDAIGPPST